LFRPKQKEGSSLNNRVSFNGTCSAALQLLHNEAAGRCAGEYRPHKHMRPPESVSDYSAAPQVLDLEAQVAVPVIGLKQGVVGVRAEELGRSTHSSCSYRITSIDRK